MAVGGGTITTLTTTSDITVQGVTVGRGAGAVATNTAVGASALAATATGGNNSGFGYEALNQLTSGTFNNAVGRRALFSNTTGSNNNAFGYGSLYTNTTGSSNTGYGEGTLYSNTTASNNTAVGYQAGYSNTTGTVNVAMGSYALYSNTTANANTALGYQAGYAVTTSISNTFIGYTAGYNTTGSYNTFVGSGVGVYGAGFFVTTGSKNTIIGGYTGNGGGLDIRTASNYIVLSDGDGNPRGYWTTSGTLVIPQTYNDTTANAANVQIDSSGVLRRSTSALKYKQDVRDIEAIDINLLRGVRYKSKCVGDDQTKDHFGIVADEADAAGITELVNYGAEGEVEGFQYERLTVVLLKAIQELKAEVDSLKAQINGASA
jgi:hypothetical protein